MTSVLDRVEGAQRMPFGEVARLPDVAAVYLVYADDALLYVGKSVRLKSRWAKHHRGQQLADLGATELRWLEVDRLDIDAAEELLISRLSPPLNWSLLPAVYRQERDWCPPSKPGIWLSATARVVGFECMCGTTTCPNCGGALTFSVGVPFVEDIVDDDRDYEYDAISRCDVCEETCCEISVDADWVTRIIESLDQRE